MGQALGNVLPLAVAIAIFPVPIIAVVLIVGSDRGRAKGLAFVLAWCAGLGAIGAIVLLLGGVFDASDAGEPATWVNVLLLTLGLLLLAASAKQWRGRPGAGAEAPTRRLRLLHRPERRVSSELRDRAPRRRAAVSSR